MKVKGSDAIPETYDKVSEPLSLKAIAVMFTLRFASVVLLLTVAMALIAPIDAEIVIKGLV